jgi:hypothetical protein
MFMKMRSIVKLTCYLFSLMASSVVVAAPVLDQSFQPSPGSQLLISSGTSSNQAMAQTFTVGVAGTLTRFDAYIEDAGAVLPVLWEIRPTVGGVPVQSDTSSLASGTFLSSAAPQNQFSFYTINLGSSPISVLPGEVLAIVFRTPMGYNGVSISWQGEIPNPYAAGSAFVGIPAPGDGTAWSTSFLTGYDMGFRTYVELVPEPSSPLLLLVGVCVVLGIRRRQTKTI